MLEALALATAAAPFNPPLGVPLAYVSREDRLIGGRTLHFESRRRLIFTREREGFRATIRFERAATDAGDDMAAMFQTAMASLVGRPIVLHLDAAGAVASIDDAEATWTALCDAIAALPGDDGKRARAGRFAAALRTLPAAQRMAMLGSLVAPLVAGADATLAPGSTQPISIRARPPLPPGATLTGDQHVTRGADGRLTLHATAAGDAPAAGGSAHVTADRDRTIDPATGLVMATHDHMSAAIGPETITADTRVTLAPVS